MDDLARMIITDIRRLNMTDMDAFVAWRLGLGAWQAAQELGGKFPHDTEQRL